MNADPTVMEFFPHPFTRQESDPQVERFEEERIRMGFCPWAVEVLGGPAFIGFVGLHEVSPVFPFSPAIEVGWRLDTRYWGQGYATEAAEASLAFGFDEVGL